MGKARTPRWTGCIAIADPRILELASRIVASGDGVLDQEYEMVWFPGDDLLAACRPRGLPIGNHLAVLVELLHEPAR